MTFANLSNQFNTRAVQRNTPVTQAIPGREADMVANNGGGFSFALDAWGKLDRFLILGTTGGTYYAREHALNADAATFIKQLAEQDGNRVVDRCVQISQAGRAKNNDFALLVMAMVITHGSDSAKRYAGSSLPLVARTGTHLLHFTQFANGMRGWGKMLKQAVQNWYNVKTPDQIAYQALKYQSRDGWSQRDVLRLAHVRAGEDVTRNNAYRYIVKGYESLNGTGTDVPRIITAYEQAKTADSKTLVKLIADHRLSHEMIPNNMKSDPAVWEALYQHMGTTALIRNLNKLTAVGLIRPFSEMSNSVIARLNDVETLRRDRIHPLTMLIAQRQYAIGHGDKGSLTWNPDNRVTMGLESGFYQSFSAVTPSNKNLFLALDVSASMNSAAHGVPLTCREAASVMAMVTLRAEPNSHVFGFDHQFRDLGITVNDNLQTVMTKTYSRNFGSTNCSLPAQFAQQQRWNIDAFVIYTDNEVNQGSNHPVQALRNYRNAMNKPDAKLISVGMAVNGFTIADPSDKGMMDVVGFDSSAPQFISAFAAGQL